MDKQTEIKTLQSLKGDTYFGQLFKDNEIDMMCENIRNDFAIESGTSIGRLLSANKSLVEQVEELKDMVIKQESLDEMMESFIKIDEDDVNNILSKHFGMMEVIKKKRKLGYALTDKEVDYLIEKCSR